MARGRTRLTTPPGEEPRPAHGRPGADEAYMPALAAPREPRYPSRWARRALVTFLLVALAGAAYWGYVETTSRQPQDPALTGEPEATATP